MYKTITGNFLNNQIYSKEYENNFYNCIKELKLFNDYDFTLIEVYEDFDMLQQCTCDYSNYCENNNFNKKTKLVLKLNKNTINNIIHILIKNIGKIFGDESLIYYKNIYLNDFKFLDINGTISGTKEKINKINIYTDMVLTFKNFYSIMDQKQTNQDFIYYVPEDTYLEQWKELTLSKMKERTQEVFKFYEDVDGKPNKNVQETFIR